MKLESHESAEEKARWKVVRLDNFSELPGRIITADEDTGKCKMSVLKPDGSTEEKEFDLGADGIAIVGRWR